MNMMEFSLSSEERMHSWGAKSCVTTSTCMTAVTQSHSQITVFDQKELQNKAKMHVDQNNK